MKLFNKQDKEIEDVIVAEREFLELKAEDDDLISAINRAMEEARPLKELMDQIGENNKIYWQKGTDLYEDNTGVVQHPNKSKVVDNRIFMSVETILPMVTARTPEPAIAGDVENELREKLVKMLQIAYEVKLKVKNKLQQIVRHWFIYRIGVWKYRWDEGFILENVLPSKIGIDPRATERGECEFVYELLEDSLEDIIETYPKSKDKIIAKYGVDKLKSKVKYIEFWGGYGKWVAWKLGNILLDKQKNPNFDYGSPAKGKEEDEDFEEAKKGTNNLFKSPQLPYLFFSIFRLGKAMYDDTSLIEQTKSLQDGTNKRKNQISDLLDENKKLIIASSKALSKEEMQKFINKYGMVGLWLSNGNIADIRVEGGQADASAYNDMAHSISEIDNVFGTHSTTRGERKEQETLGGRRLLVASDFGRAETISENVEQLMEDFYNAFLHMSKVYGLEDEVFSDGEETIKLSTDEIPEGILVIVKKGSTLPVDKASRAEMAIKLAEFDKIDPKTLFEELGYGDSDERTEELYEWLRRTGKVVPQEVGAPGGGGAGGENDPRLVRLQDIINSPNFQQLSPEDQKEMVVKAREIIEQVKRGDQGTRQ
jgi:hypothetical protein